MPKSSLPPAPPKSGSGPLIGAIVALIVVAGAIGWWKFGGSEPPAEPTASTAPPEPTEAPEIHNAPPPPPPPVASADAGAAPKPEAAAKRSAKPSGPSGCAGSCNGTIDASFRSALREKAGLARSCYNRGLRQNSSLEGKMTVAVRVSPTGRVCSVGTASDSLGDAAVRACILQKFRTGRFPKPRGGCVDAQVPLNFVAKR